jgi:hypothetical protein
MTTIRSIHEDEVELVRDLWLRMCVEAGTPLSERAAQQILANLKQYADHEEVRCFVAEEEQVLIGFLTCSVAGHPVMPGRAGEIEELYVQASPQQRMIQAELVKQAVIFMQGRGARSIHVRIGIGEESPKEEEQRAFWQALGWVNDMTIYSIYSNVPGVAALQLVWNEYQRQT